MVFPFLYYFFRAIIADEDVLIKMKFDSTITITVVIAISAIISPIITTLLNNHHLYKMRKLDDETELRKTSYFYKRGIFEDYMRYAGQCVTHATSDALENYGATYALALIYFPDELLDKIIDINASLNRHQWANALVKLNELSPELRKQLQKL